MRPFYYDFVNRRDFNLRAEPEGDIQPKYWFSRYGESKKYPGNMLVKRAMIQKGSKRIPRSIMHNHVGEYMGYLLGNKMGMNICPVHLISFYDKEKRQSRSFHLYPACASVSVLKYGQNLEHGEAFIESLKYSNPGKIPNIIEKSKSFSTIFPRRGVLPHSTDDEHIEVILAAIDDRVKDFETKMGKRTPEEIQQDIKDAKRAMIEMVVYDCAFGNNDRHSRNWGLMLDRDSGRASIYAAYDNERVLGLCASEYEMKSIVEGGQKAISAFQLKYFFSRIGFGVQKGGVYYEDMLMYLVERHPEEAVPAIKKVVDNVKPEFVSKLYDSFEDIEHRSSIVSDLPPEEKRKFVLPPYYKEFGTRMYNERYRFMQRLLERHKEEKPIDFDNARATVYYKSLDNNNKKSPGFKLILGNHDDQDGYQEAR